MEEGKRNREMEGGNRRGRGADKDTGLTGRKASERQGSGQNQEKGIVEGAVL